MPVNIIENFRLGTDLPLDSRYVVDSYNDVSIYWYAGMQVFQNSDQQLYWYDGSIWNAVEDTSISGNFATIEYVDGSLAIRDVSIDKLFSITSNLEVSIGSLDILTQLHDVSLGNLTIWQQYQDNSIGNLDTLTQLHETSLGQLNIWNQNQDTSLIRIDGSLNFIFNNGLEFIKESSIGSGFIWDEGQLDVSTSGAVGLYAYSRTAASGNIISAYSLDVSKSGTGTYDYTFINPLSASEYAVIAQPYGLTSDTNIQVSSVLPSGFTLLIGYGDNGTAPDVPVDVEHSVMVLGPPTEMGLGVSRDYVDGSLGARDASIIRIDQNIDNIESSIGSLNTWNQTQDSSIVELRNRLDSPALGKIQLVDSSGGQSINDIAANPLTWSQQDFYDPSTFTHAIGDSSVGVLQTGLYELSFNINGESGNGRSIPGIQFRNNSIVIAPTLTADYGRNTANNDTNNALPPYLISLTVNDVLDVIAFRLGTGTTNTSKTGGSFMRINYLG